MTNDPRIPKRPDDPLAEALRNEVPAPGAGYWDAIDARIAGAAGERSADNVIRLDHSGTDTDTGETVIRLTDMNTQTPAPTSPSRNLVLALAAVAALIVGVVGFTALRDTSPTTVEFTDDPAETSPDIDGTDPDSSTESPDPEPTPTTEDAAPTDEAPTVDDEPAPFERRCFFEQYLPEDEPDPTVVWIIEIGADSFRALLESPGPDGTTNQTFDFGTIDADGNGVTSAGMMIQLSDSGASRTDGEFEPFTAAEVDCSTIADVDDRFDRLAAAATE